MIHPIRNVHAFLPHAAPVAVREAKAAHDGAPEAPIGGGLGQDALRSPEPKSLPWTQNQARQAAISQRV